MRSTPIIISLIAITLSRIMPLYAATDLIPEIGLPSGGTFTVQINVGAVPPQTEGEDYATLTELQTSVNQNLTMIRTAAAGVVYKMLSESSIYNVSSCPSTGAGFSSVTDTEGSVVGVIYAQCAGGAAAEPYTSALATSLNGNDYGITCAQSLANGIGDTFQDVMNQSGQEAIEYCVMLFAQDGSSTIPILSAVMTFGWNGLGYDESENYGDTAGKIASCVTAFGQP